MVVCSLMDHGSRAVVLLMLLRFMHRLFCFNFLFPCRCQARLSFVAPFFLVLIGGFELISDKAFAASPDYPVLSGRVVDQASILTAEEEFELVKLLQAVEGRSTDQIVVVTVASLQGYPIEDYSIGLARHWGIGQAGKDNGVVLLVAPKERRVRIEVGRGLEGLLPDALAGLIIQRRILPAFRKGDFAGGIRAGVEDIRASLLGNKEEIALRAKKPAQKIDSYLPFIFVAFWLIPFIYFISSLNRDRRVSGRVPGGVVIVPGGFGRVEDSWSGPGGFSRRSGGGFGGGFSGGGGGFGGGGASGSW